MPSGDGFLTRIFYARSREQLDLLLAQIAGSAEVHGEALPASSRPAGLLEFDAVLACPVCGAADRDGDVRVLSDALHGVPGAFRYARCRNCRSTYQTPRVAEASLNECYPEGYFTHSHLDDPVPRAGALRRRVQLGWTAEGLDIDPAAAKSLTLVVVTYNACRDLQDCLVSISATDG